MDSSINSLMEKLEVTDALNIAESHGKKHRRVVTT